MPQRPPQHRPKIQPKSYDAVRGTAARRGYGSAWSRFRKQWLIDHPVCVFADHPFAKRDCLVAASIVDHIDPLRSQGDEAVVIDPNNVRSTCVKCHQKLTARYRTEGINEMPMPLHAGTGPEDKP